MGKMRMVKRCIKCGSPLQSVDPFEEGYISKETLSIEGNNPSLCSSCYEATKWNDAPTQEKVDDNFLSIIKDAKERKAFFVYVIDVFSFESAFVESVSKELSDEKILIVANKRDLLPENTDEDALKDYIAHQFHAAGMPSITTDDVFIRHILLNGDLSDVYEEIEARSEGKDIYLIGATKSGKSRFVSAFLSTYKNDSKRLIHQSPYKDTNLDVLEIPLSEERTLYDIPGFPNDNSVFGHENTPKEAIVLEGTPVKPLKMSIEPKGAVFIGLLGHIDCVNSSRRHIAMTCYFAKNVDIKKITPKKDMNSLFDKYLEKKALKPRLPLLHTSKDFDAFEFAFDDDKPRDVGIAGLGWVTIDGRKGESFRVYVPKGIGAYITRQKIKMKGEKQ